MSSATVTQIATLDVPKLLAIGVDKSGLGKFRLYRARNKNGRPVKVLVPDAAALEGERGILNILNDHNVRVPYSRRQQTALIAGMDGQRTTKQVKIVEVVGWQGKRFVLPGRTYPSAKPAIVNLRKDFPTDKFGRAGTLAQWQSKVAGFASGNPAAVFAIMLAFAPPLLKLLGAAEIGGFQFVAKAETGKTTIAIAAGSVWGGSDDRGFTEAWLTTENAIDDTAADHNDLLLIFDETAHVAGDEKAQARMIAHVVYRIAGGRGKTRMGAANKARWRLLLLSTSERTCRQIAALGRQPIADGQLSRMVDIVLPVTPERGIFQDLHGRDTPNGFGAALTTRATRFYGTAGDAFLNALTSWIHTDRPGCRKWLRQQMAYYKRHSKVVVSGRIDRRFALVFAAGQLARRFKIIPWAREQLLEAVMFCHQHVDRPTLPIDPVLVVRQFIEAHRSEFIDLSGSHRLTEKQASAAAGFCYLGPNKQPEYLFIESRFSTVCGSTEKRVVLAGLKEAGLLNQTKDGKSTVHRSLPKPVGRTRVISIKADRIR